MTSEYQNFQTEAFYSHFCGEPLGRSGDQFRYHCPHSLPGKNHIIYVSPSATWCCHHAKCAGDSRCPVQKGGPRQFLSLVRPELSDYEAFQLLNRFGRSVAVSPGLPASREKPPRLWQTLADLTASMPKWTTVKTQIGKPAQVTASYLYHFSNGREAFAVTRVDGPLGKIYLQAKAVPGGWQTGGLKAHRPLFMLLDLPKSLAIPVLITEGEKCATALRAALKKAGFDAWVTTPSQGAMSPQKSDWTPIEGRLVHIFPDNDEPGQMFALQVGELCRQAGAKSVKLISPFYGREPNDGRDIADFITENGNSETIVAAIQAAAAYSQPSSLSEPPSLPTIQIQFGPGTLSEMATCGIEALIKGNAGIYQRSGDLVMIKADEKARLPGIRWPLGEPRITPVSPATLRDKLDSMATWKRFDARNNNWVVTRPPKDAVEIILGRQEWPKLPTLSMIFETPTMRLDGTIIDNPGWDPATGIYFMPKSGEHWNTPTYPTSQEIHAAREALLEVHCDFPFEKECHHAAAVAGILTLLSGLTYLNRPLFMWDANVRGAGKTLGADVSSLIATGRDFPKMIQGSSDSEDRKRITTLAMAGARAVLVDNIVGRFGNAAIDAAITAEGFWEDRLLSQNRTWKGPLFLTWFATGNNIEVQGDLSRRVIPIRILSDDERPERRTGYRHPNLRAWAKAERVRLATAGLTILRGYQAAGKPDQRLINFGSFEEWSSTVRQAVVWAGLPDPYAGNEDVQQKADSDAVGVGTLLQAWYAVFREMPLPLSKIARMEPVSDPQTQDEEFRNDALIALHETLISLAGNDHGNGWSPKKAGWLLRKFEKRVIRGLRFEQCAETRMGVAWKVRQMRPGELPELSFPS